MTGSKTRKKFLVFHVNIETSGFQKGIAKMVYRRQKISNHESLALEEERERVK